MIYRIACDLEKCRQCGRCEKHWPGIKKRLNGHGFFELFSRESMEIHWHQYEWAKNLCPEEAISLEVRNNE